MIDLAGKIEGGYVKDAVIRAIVARWPDAKVYEEEIAQGLETPCFLVFEINAIEKKALDKQRERTHQLSVRWIPKEGSRRQYNQCADIGNDLMRVLELVNTDTEPIRATALSYRVEKSVLLFDADYEYRMADAGSDPKQKNLDIKEGLK